jgi:O-methyltransferase involved in polyketide biosynthesis
MARSSLLSAFDHMRVAHGAAARERSVAMSESTARVSPTAYYTGHVWCRNGLSHPALDTREGAALFTMLRPVMLAGRAVTRGVALEEMLLQRHKIIDHLLSREIEAGRISQVLELAAGMSGRGVRFARRFGASGLVYVEGDLPGMAHRKRDTLASAGLGRPGHHVVAVDVLTDVGAQSLTEATQGLFDTRYGIAVITEGLLSYLDTPSVEGLWRRIAAFVAPYSADIYLSDLHLGGRMDVAAVRVFRNMLQVFARGRTHVHFKDEADVAPAFAKQGFPRAVVHRPSDWGQELALPGVGGLETVQVLEASTRL